MTDDTTLLGQDGAMAAYQGHWNRLRSSDSEVFRAKDGAASAARDLSRTNAFAKSATRAVVDSVIGASFRLTVDLDTTRLGITPEEAQAWEALVKSEWGTFAESNGWSVDARRQQNFSGLMRTAFASYFVTGEALASIEWKRNPYNQYSTCVLLHDPEKLSDPHGTIAVNEHRRMGVEQDQHGAPIAYWLRRQVPSDGIWEMGHQYQWTRYARTTGWGRARIVHGFEHDRPAMARGISAFTTAIDPLTRHDQYLATELEAAAVRSMFALSISSELDYEDAMNLLGPDQRMALQANGPLSLALQMMSERTSFYGAQDLKVGKARVVHLLPNEKLETVAGNMLPGVLKEFSETALFQIASALGVDNSVLTKNFSQTNYSGARVAMAEIERSYSVRRTDFVTQFALPIIFAWLEEAIVIRKTIPMPGGASFYAERGAIKLGCAALGRIPVDPFKEMQAKQLEIQMGVTTMRDVCNASDLDWRDVLTQRAAEKKMMDTLGLKPEDLDWSLLAQGLGAADAPKPDNGSTGSKN